MILIAWVILKNADGLAVELWGIFGGRMMAMTLSDDFEKLKLLNVMRIRQITGKSFLKSKK